MTVNKQRVEDLMFLRLQTSALCRKVTHERGETSLVDWLYGIDKTDGGPFYIVHEWCCSVEHVLNCFENVQLVDPDGTVEANLRMSTFQLGVRFWDVIRNYWEVTEFHPTQSGTHEIHTALVDVDSEEILFHQIDPLHVL